MDTLTPLERSVRMALIRSRNTKPELVVRSMLHRMGFRFRLHRRGLPGTPDLVFPGRQKTIFVHGCFWHGHSCSLGNRIPKSRVEFWKAKIASNQLRDRRQMRALRKLGWNALVVWECQLSDKQKLAKRLKGYLDAQH